MNRLKELRQEQNLKQDVIAKLLSVETSAISKLENGKVPLRDTYIIILSDFFDVSTDYLLGRTDIKNDTDPFGLKKLGFNINNYNLPDDNQKELIKGLVEVVLKNNKKQLKN